MNWQNIVKYNKNYRQNVDDMIARALRVKTEMTRFYVGGAEYTEVKNALDKYVAALREHKQEAGKKSDRDD